jgi:multidrug resistance efflux pump
MSKIEAKGQPEKTESPREVAELPDAAALAPPLRRGRGILPILITLAAVALAIWLSRAMWNSYMAAPWTRDGTVRAYIVTIAPEVEGKIVALPIADNQLVRKGDLLMVIDPRNYSLAVQQAEAGLGQAQANAQNIDAQIAIQQAQIAASEAQVEEAQAALKFGKQQAQRYQELAHEQYGTIQLEQQSASTLREDRAGLKNTQAAAAVAQRQIEALKAQRRSADAMIAEATAQLDQAKVNLERTRIVSPVNGYVTNLLAQLGDYANVGQNKISIVNADSFWVDGYFEETILGPVHVGDPVEITLMGYRQIVRGHVDSIARAINVANAQPNGQGVATVNPIFTWVRLAQRLPVRIHIDQVPEGVVLAAGMTATVQITPGLSSPESKR